jgi:L-threonylcarbamoyladenylate synthase
MIKGDCAGAISCLKSGGIIAYPTEAVYGIGCDPYNKDSVKKITQIKKRESRKSYILVASELSQLSNLININSLSEEVLNSWPGHNTWLIKPKKNIPSWLMDNENGLIAIRVSSHPEIVKLCQFFKNPIISTSANISGNKILKNHHDVERILGSYLDYLVLGNVGEHPEPSIIKDMKTGKVIR